jgi:hypothetical protein
MSFMTFAKVIAGTITQELELADRLMDRMGKQDILIAYQACILVLEHELCICQRIETTEAFTDFLNEYSNSFVLKDEPQELAGIFALNHIIRKPILQALAQRTTEIFLAEASS